MGKLLILFDIGIAEIFRFDPRLARGGVTSYPIR
jgi:hypothetical protein